MSIQKRILAVVTGMTLYCYSLLAFAVYGQQVIIQGIDASSTQGQTITFATESGQSVDVDVESSQDGRTVVNLRFDSDRINGRSEGGLLTIGQGADAIPIEIPSASADEVVLVDLDRGSARAQPRAASPNTPPGAGWALSIGGFASDLTTPEIGTSGVTSEGGVESFNLRGIDSVDLAGLNISVSRNLGGPRDATWFGGYRSGSGDDQFTSSVPTMTTNTALVFTDFAEQVTGIGLTPFGVNSAADVDVDQSEGNFGFRFNLLGEPGQRHRWSPGVVLTIGDLEIQQRSVDSLVDPIFGGVDPTVTRNQKLEQSYYEVYPSIRFTNESSQAFAWYMEAGPVIRRIDADWTSSERIECAACGAPLVDVSVDRTDSHSGTSVGGKVQTGFEIRISENTAIEASAFYRGGMDNAAPVNPQSGDDLAIRNQPSYLSTDKSSEFGGRVRIIFSF